MMGEKEPLFRMLWAKSEPFHELWRHVLDVAAVAKALWSRFGLLEDMPLEWVCYVCAMHDVGKADPWFQNKAPARAVILMEAGLALPERADTAPDNKRLFRHEVRSSEWLITALQQRGWGTEAALVVCEAISLHHACDNVFCYGENAGDKTAAAWQEMRNDLSEMVWDVLQPPDYTPEEFKHASVFGVILLGLVVLADWIASNSEIFDYSPLHTVSDPAEYFEKASALAVRVVNDLALGPPRIDGLKVNPGFSEVWPKLTGSLRPTQAALEMAVLAGNAPPGLAIIEAPMGEGKTEAAIYLAEHWNRLLGHDGLYIGLPTMATSNQMYGRYAKFLQVVRPEAESRLVHGMAWLIDDESPSETSQTFGPDVANPAGDERAISREWFRPLRRALLAAHGVGTIDQAMMAALSVKFGVLRLLGLRTKVLVIDEAHAYDLFMTTILEHLLKWCRALKIPVILLSATLSGPQKKRLAGAYGCDTSDIGTGKGESYPLLTFCPFDSAPLAVAAESPAANGRRLDIKLRWNILDDAPAIARLALERIANGGCACVLMNTVKAAQEVYCQVELLLEKGEFAQPDYLQLFHARFRAELRAEIESSVTEKFGPEASLENGVRPRRGLLVATSVVEMSLDVDFDYFITQLAPIDLLLQRSGRLWRHIRDILSERPPGCSGPLLDILMPAQGSLEFGVVQKVYARLVLLRTLDVLQQYPHIELPNDFRPLIEAVYGETPATAQFVDADEIATAGKEWLKKKNEQEKIAAVHLLPDPSPRVFEWSQREVVEAVDGEAGNYLRAGTRLGDLSRAALVLSDPDLLQLAAACSDAAVNRALSRDEMKRLFAQKVNVPVWWFACLEGAEGYVDCFEGSGRLRGHLIVPLCDGQWRNINGATVTDDLALGLRYDAAATEKPAEEADAGDLGG